MAIRPVRFEFYCEDDNGGLEYTHNLPSSLWATRAQLSEKDARYIEQFTNAVRPIMKEHEATCRAASNPFCKNCGSSAVRVMQTPMSFLHVVDDPFVGTWVNPVCRNGECEIQILQEVQGTMSKAVLEGQTPRGSRPSTSFEVMLCNVCGKVGEVKRCGRCKVVAYCGKEHQKVDWKVHKRTCVSKVALETHTASGSESNANGCELISGREDSAPATHRET